MRLGRLAKIALGLAGLIGLAVAGWSVYNYLRIDSCLDAGGSWHYDDHHCDFETDYAGPVP